MAPPSSLLHSPTLRPLAVVTGAGSGIGFAQRFAGRPASHVFANAGIGGASGDVLDLPDAAWQWAWGVNVLGAPPSIEQALAPFDDFGAPA